MVFTVPLAQAQLDFPQYTFVEVLTPSEQKAAFHVKDAQGNDLCLKIISPSYQIDRLTREIRALQTIKHANVVSLLEYTFTSKAGAQRHYMIEEFVAGTDLSNLMIPKVPWPTLRAASFFSALCDGLSCLNKENIVHRDLKPTNIRVRQNGSPVIIDFGVARLLDMPDLTSTSEGASLGTPLYFAPEQFNGTKHDIDHRTDLFALGVLLFQATTGIHPFFAQSMNYAQLKDSVSNSSEYLQSPQFTKLPDEWRLVIGRLLEKERSRRPRDASQVASILRKIGVKS